MQLVLHRGPRGSMLVAGVEARSRYLADLFLGTEHRTSERLGSWPVWRLHPLLEHWRRRVDVVVARVDVLSARWFPPDRYLRIPDWVRMTAAVPATGQRIASSQARRNERLARRHGLTWRISHDPRELAIFIDRDYRPYTSARHGDAAYLRPKGWFLRRFRRGGLIWIERRQEPVAGLTYDVHGRSLRRLAAACTRGDATLLRTGAMSATYLACFDLARTLGCDMVDLRNCRPCLIDGLLQAKQSWGGSIAQTDDVTHDLFFGWCRATPSVIRFLSTSPLIVRDGTGFAAVHGDEAASAAQRMPCGIDRLFIPELGGRFGDWTIRSVVS